MVLEPKRALECTPDGGLVIDYEYAGHAEIIARPRKSS
jgi:hypothetical protein